MKKRIFAGIVSVIFLCSILLSCGKKEPTSQQKPVKVTIMVDTKADFPLWNYIRQKSGMQITLDIVPNQDIRNTILLRKMAHENLPDLVYLKNYQDMQVLAQEGLLQDLRKYKDELFSYQQAFFVTEASQEMERMAYTQDGGMYLLPALGTIRIDTEKAWLYRADIFKKAKIAIPNTMQELLEAAILLKKIFPNSTPLAIPDGLYGLNSLAPAWKNDASIGAYYDFEKDTWCYGATEAWMGNFISYWANMVRNGLMPKNCFTMKPMEIEKLIAQNRIFIMPDTISKLERYRKKYPQQDWCMMPAPKAATEGAQHKIAKTENPLEGYAICNTGKEDTTSNAIAFLNWMYSEEAEEVLSWGLEGESYQVQSTEKKLLLEKTETAKKKYGIGTDGLCIRLDPKTEKYLAPKETIQNAYLASIYTEKNVNPVRYIQLTEEEQKKIWREENKLNLVMDAALSDFLTGKRPMSEWATFAQSLKSIEIKQILTMYKKAYQRTQD